MTSEPPPPSPSEKVLESVTVTAASQNAFTNLPINYNLWGVSQLDSGAINTGAMAGGKFDAGSSALSDSSQAEDPIYGKQPRWSTLPDGTKVENIYVDCCSTPRSNPFSIDMGQVFNDLSFVPTSLIAGPEELLAFGVFKASIIIGKAAKGATAIYDANKISHIFNGKHMLDPLVSKFGSQEAALNEMHKAAQSLATTPGAYQTGAWATIKVEGIPVSVKGAVINGEFNISTATMRPF